MPAVTTVLQSFPPTFPAMAVATAQLIKKLPLSENHWHRLQATELAPFFDVTGLAPDPITVADGLLTTHVRYQGFQGNIQATTAPVSLDTQALSTLLQLPAFASWRTNGGLIVSDKLGGRAIQRFYDNSAQQFPHRQIAKDALLAGNDLLYLADFKLESAPNEVEITNIQDTIISFQERYSADATFRQRVDQATLTILATKLRLYANDFSPENVLVDILSVGERVGQPNNDLTTLAQQAITLIAPNPEELPARLPNPPGNSDQIVIFTDVRQIQACPDCSPTPLIDQFALENRLIELYGSDGSGQISATQLQSFSFEDLTKLLDAGNSPIPLPTPAPTFTPPSAGTPPATPAPTPPPPADYLVQQALANADWVIFVTLNKTPELPASNTLSRFLAERPDLTQDNRTIVFAFGSPIYLDTTEISKLSAYYGVYSHTPQFLDASARVLFQESPVFGRSPINIDAVSYHLTEITQPDPEQVIELFIVADGVAQSPGRDEPFQGVIGDSIRLQTGIISDHNGNPVPDGTIVEFKQLDRTEGLLSVVEETATINGVATLDYILEDRLGKQYGIIASAGNADKSVEVDIAIGDNVIIQFVTPPPAPTDVPTPTPHPTETPTPTRVILPTATPTITPSPAPPESTINIPVTDVTQLLGMIGGLGALGIAGILLSNLRHWQPIQLTPRLLWGMVGGLSAYIYFALHMPGTQTWWDSPVKGAVFSALAGGLVFFLARWLYESMRDL